jgi:hypothetical protein
VVTAVTVVMAATVDMVEVMAITVTTGMAMAITGMVITAITTDMAITSMFITAVGSGPPTGRSMSATAIDFADDETRSGQSPGEFSPTTMRRRQNILATK